MCAVESSQPIVPFGQIGPAQSLALGAPSPTAPFDEAAAISAKDVWRVVKQRKVLILITFAVFYLLVLAATFLIYRYAPAYANEAYVKLIPPVEGYGFKEPILPKDYIAHRLSTEAAAIRNPALLQDVLSLPEIKATHYFQWYGDNFDKCLYEFQDLLSVSPVRDSYLIRVGIAVRDREEARLIVNRVVDRYISRSRSVDADEGRQKLETLKNTQANALTELAQVRNHIKTLREQRDMPALESERDVMVDSIGVLTNTMAELKARQADVEAQLSTLHGRDPRNLPLSADMRVIIESDPVLRYYRQQVEQADISIAAALRNMMGKNHRVMQYMVDQRDGYSQKEAARREELIDDLRSRQVESLEQEKARIRNMMAEVHEQLIEKENTQRDLDGALQTFKNLTSDEDRISKQLEDVSKQANEAENQIQLQNKEGKLVPIFAVRDPYLPSRPNFVLYLGGGFVMALLLAVGLAFLREFTDQAIRTPIDVARYGHLSVLGSIPLLDDEEADLDEIELATRRAPQSLVAEAFRQIRAHLTFSGPLLSQQVLLITSPRPDDGKTATAINMAVTFAQGNQRVLLIDCNFRRPRIRAAFPDSRSEGLSNVLVGRSTFADVIRKTELPNLDVMNSGPMPPNPAELLGSVQMRDLLAEAKQHYDRVFLDGPPCLLISDALVLATQVDATVLVARAATGSKGALRRAREQFQRVNARIIGAVLNGVQARPGGYYRQQYREFYEYTSDEIVPQELPGGPPEIESEAPFGPSDPPQT